MSITTWGWGCQGGLISISGWGGCSPVSPEEGAVGIPCRPVISESWDLRPEVSGSGDEGDRPIVSLSMDLSPSLIARSTSLTPETAARELRPSIRAGASDLIPEIDADELKPSLVVDAEDLRP